jgi:hypothetical protein
MLTIIDSSLQNFREMFSPQEIVDNYKNGIDFTENQRFELSESESAEGDISVIDVDIAVTS